MTESKPPASDPSDDALQVLPPWNYDQMCIAAESGQFDKETWSEVRKWARRGDAGAQFLMSYANLSQRTRRKWLLAAAAQNHAEACYNLYTLSYQDVSWLIRAAELGWPDGQSALGCHFATLPVPDLIQSRHWYLQAALQGDPAAMYEIGFTLLLGEGGPADPVQAVDWLEKSAAAETHTYSEDVRRLLVQIYTDGSKGVTKNPERAKYWKNAQPRVPKDPLEGIVQRLHLRGLKGLPEMEYNFYLGAILVKYMQGSPRPDVVDKLLQRGADPNEAIPGPTFFHSSTALSWSTGDLEIVQLLVAAGAKVPKELRQKRIISVHEACQHGRLEVLKVLIDQAEGRAALEVFDADHRTPLILASAEGRLETVQYLLSLGADPNLCQYDSALDLAIMNGHPQVAQLLREVGAETLLEFGRDERPNPV